ncbi:hypothetical protein CHUAL_011882 [Chamberlinius hualienensis]
MTFGNYVLFNLLVAILVEGFSAERHEFECEEKHLQALTKMKGEEQRKAKQAEEAALEGAAAAKNEQMAADNEKELKKLRQLDLEDDNFFSDPKCNIIRETRMLHLPPSVTVIKSTEQPKSPESLSCQHPPIITRTAATPQGSPNATLDPSNMRDFSGCMLFPSSFTSLDTVDRASLSALSIPSVTNCQGFTRGSTTQLSVHFAASRPPVSPQLMRRGSLSTEASHPRRKDSLSPSPSRLQRKGSHGSASISPRLQRRESKGSVYSWRRKGRRRGDQENLVDLSDIVVSDEYPSGYPDRSNPASDDEKLLNNNLNNLQSVNIIQQDRSHCNGGLTTLQNSPNYKRNILTQPNSISTPLTLSPQNSIRSRPPTPRVAPFQLPTGGAAVGWQNSEPLSRNNSIRNALSRQNSTRSNVSTANGRSHGHHCNGHQSNCHDQHKRDSIIPGSRHNSISGSCKDEFKPNNLESANLQTGLSKSQEMALEREEQLNSKMCWFFDMPLQLKERDAYSLFLFPPENSFRQLCVTLAEKKWFDYTVLVFIALNCITLAMERPNIPPDSTERLFLTSANYVFTVVFAVEMFVKVVAWGLWYGPRTYFRSGWNVMDGILVIVSLVDILMSMYSTSSPKIFGILRVFRLLRSLRPLRVINRAPGLKLVVQTLLSSLRPIGNIVLICCTFFIIFGILGVQLFKGTFYYCEGPNIKSVRNKTECEMVDERNQWLNRKYNFDDLGQALMALFVLSSKDGWVNIMYQGLDAVGVDIQPIQNYSEWRLLYFISFLLLVGFFVLNMFVGVVVENFHRCREEQEKEEKARRAEKRAKKLEKKRRKMRDPPYFINYSRPRLFIHNIVTSKYFDLAIAAVIGLNVITMAMEFYMMPSELIYALEIFNYFFSAVFVLEAAMKMLALGAARYFVDKWNQLDVIIVILSVVGIVLEKMQSVVMPINPTIIRVMRVLRIARVLKLLKMAKGIRALLDTVMQALPQVGNLGLLFFLLFFIFAALGVELFGRLECDEKNPCQGLGEHAHFKNFGMAFLTLFRVATGDNWNGIMKDTLREYCDSSAECVRNCCVSPIIAPLYFVVFVLMAQFVLVNVVVAVLMKHLEESHKQMEDDIDMDEELEQELAAEEAAAAAAEVAKSAAMEQLKLQHLNQVAGNTLIMYPLHKPIYKMASLPANFTFSGDDTDTPPLSPTNLLHVTDVFDTGTAAPIDFHHHQHFLNHQTFPASGGGSTKSRLGSTCMCDDVNNVNIRQASPEEPVDKVAVADLRTSISPAPSLGSYSSLHLRSSGSPSGNSNRNSLSLFPHSYLSNGMEDMASNKDVLSLPGSQWSIDNSYALFPNTSYGEGILTSLSSSSTVEPTTPNRCHVTLQSTPLTPEGGNLCPPPTYQSVVGKSRQDHISLDSLECELATPFSPSTLSSFHLSIFDNSEVGVERSGTLESIHDLFVFEEKECLSGNDGIATKGQISRTPSTSLSHVTTSSSAESSPSSSHHLLDSNTSKSTNPEPKKVRRRISTPTTTTTDSLGIASIPQDDNLSSLNLTGIGGQSSIIDDDFLTDEELGFYDSLEKTPPSSSLPVPLQQQGSVTEAFDDSNEDIIIMNPTRNTIICIYRDAEQQPLLSTSECDSTYRTSREDEDGDDDAEPPSSASNNPLINTKSLSATQDNRSSKLLHRTAHEASKSPDSEDSTSSGVC